MCKYFLEPKGIWYLRPCLHISNTHNFVFICCFASLVLILIQYFLTRLPNFFSDIVEISENKSFQARQGWSTTAAGGVRMSSQGARWLAERNQQENQGARWPRGTNKKNLCRHQNGSSLPQTKHRVVHSSTRMRNRNTFLWKRDGLENQYPGIVYDKHKIKGRGNWNT